MTTYYIATTGNDVTGDGSSGNPWATFTKACATAASGDTIMAAGGTYAEKFSIAGKTLTLTATGAVILDGTNTLAGPGITFSSSSTIRTFTMDVSGGGTWELKRYTGSNALIQSLGTSAQVINIASTTFTSNANAYGYFNNAVAISSVLTINLCTFTGNFSVAAIYTNNGTAPGAATVTNSTFTDCAYSYWFSSTSSPTTFTGNVVSKCYGALWAAGATGGSVTASNNTYSNVYAWGYSNVARTWSIWKSISGTHDNTGSTSTTPGMTIYVTKSGNDSNTGYDIDNSKLTISSAISSSISGGVIVTGSGLYNEALTTGDKSLAFNARGNVILDGTGLGTTKLVTFNASTPSTYMTFQGDTVTGGTWTFQNSSATVIVNMTAAAATPTASFYNCTFLAFSNSAGAITYSGGQVITLNLANCVFANFTGATCYTIFLSANSPATNINHCTAYNGGVFLYAAQVGAYLNMFWFHNIISNYTTGFWTSNGFGTVNTYGNDYYSVTNWKNIGSTYTTLAQVQALGPTYEANSVTSDPQMEDPANGVFYLKTQSSVDRTMGAYPFGYATGSAASDAKWIITASADNTGWYNADGNVSKNGTTGFFELTAGTTGTIVSPVIDLGSVQAVRQVNLAMNQTWPTNMVDYSKVDTKPNYQTVRIRASGSSFTQGAVSPSWVEVKTDQMMSVMSGRYVQLELVLRTDDVAA